MHFSNIRKDGECGSESMDAINADRSAVTGHKTLVAIEIGLQQYRDHSGTCFCQSLSTCDIFSFSIAGPRVWNSLPLHCDSMIDRARRNRYCALDLPSFDVLCDDADDELFSKAVRLSNHVLHPLLPPPSVASQSYNLRKRMHSLQLPDHNTHLANKNFITHMLYKNAY